MKEKLKKFKPYFIGMTIGLFLVSSGVIADTIIDSPNVSYESTNVKNALDELYELADLKEDVEMLKSYVSKIPTEGGEIGVFNGTGLQLGKVNETIYDRNSFIDMFYGGVPKANIYTSTTGLHINANNTNLNDKEGRLWLNGVAFDTVLAYRGYAKDVSSNFDEITTSGFYYLDLTEMTNAPCDLAKYQWSYLIVVTAGGSNSMVHQYVIKPVDHVFYMREYSGSPGKWHDWWNTNES